MRSALSYFFLQISLMSCLIAGLSSAFNLLWYIALMEVPEENLPSHRYVVRMYLNSLLRQLWYFLFDTTSKLDTHSFLGVSCNVESDLFILYYVKIHWQSCSLNRFLPTHNFPTSHFGHMGDTGSLSYMDLSNAGTFHYMTFKKITFISIIPNLIRQVFR